MLCLALLLPLAWAAQADSTCERNDAKGTSLLSLKADAVRSRDTRDIFADVVSTFADNASAANDSNASWQRVNQSLHQSVQDLVTCLQSFCLKITVHSTLCVILLLRFLFLIFKVANVFTKTCNCS